MSLSMAVKQFIIVFFKYKQYQKVHLEWMAV